MKAAVALTFGVLVLQARPLPPALAADQQIRAVGEPYAVLDAEKAWLGADAFWPLAKGGDVLTRRYAIRAIGRLEDPTQVPALLALGKQDPRAEIYTGVIADAIVQSLYEFDPSRDPELVAQVSAWFLHVALIEEPKPPRPLPLPLGRITYATDAQFHAAERKLMRILEKFESVSVKSQEARYYVEAAIALESLLRLNPRFGPPDEATMTRLPRMVRGTRPLDTGEVAVAAFRALMGRGLDADTEKFALTQGGDVGRLATQVLGGNGGGLDDDQRLAAILDKLKTGDKYEALRAYMRHGVAPLGCQPIVDLINDRNTHVMLAAIDALGEACKEDEEVTRRLANELRVPPAIGPWHRETHLFVTVAKRSPEQVALFMNAFTTHPVWWIRMYAVNAVVAANDTTQLEKLALDDNDNVREVALEPLLVLKKAKTDSALIADLDRNDVQLLRTAAILARAAPAEEKLRAGLLGALLRLTSEGKETSRDGRLALIEALEVHARPPDVERLRHLARDFDPLVAAAAVKLLGKLGTDVKADPMPVRRGWTQQFTDLSKQCVDVALSSGRSFTMQMRPDGAPIAVDRFLKLALVDHYYDGLAIHRVVPNFVVQAGSPGSNEYSGHKEYMRDEIALPNKAGSVGLSIRGRNTGDAQFYVNLVDNPRLDRGYTIFARVVDVSVVDAIEEGEVMTKITSIACK
jgi:cyclophilin family peptidyl-prolyl cis-trans isomerase